MPTGPTRDATRRPWAVFAVAIVAVSIGPSPAPVDAQGETSTLTVRAHNTDVPERYWFTIDGHPGDNPTVPLTAGGHVIVEFFNEGTAFHNFHVLGAVDTEVIACCVAPGEHATGGFDVPADAAGSVPYQCDPHGASMKGTFSVTGSDGGGDTGGGDTGGGGGRVNKPPVAGFSSSPAAPTTADVVTFDGAASSDPDGWLRAWDWEFGDGSPTAAGKTVTHRYFKAGMQMVRLTVRDNEGATGSAVQHLTIADLPPVAAFTVLPERPTTADDVVFDGSTSADADGTVVGWSWRFGDGGAGTGKAVTHRYADDGIYRVTLTATDDDGSASSSTADVAVLNVGPTAAFTFTPSDPTTAAPVAFHATATDADGTVAVWAWDFGDEGSSSEPDPAHHYARPGLYAVYLSVQDDDGALAVAGATVAVRDPSTPPPAEASEGGPSPVGSSGASVAVARVPVARFSFAPERPTILDRVTFADTSTPGDAPLVAWRWAFDDGTTSDVQAPVHSYANPGNYTVVLVVTDGSGATGRAERTLGVAIATFGTDAPAPTPPSSGLEQLTTTALEQDPSGVGLPLLQLVAGVCGAAFGYFRKGPQNKARVFGVALLGGVLVAVALGGLGYVFGVGADQATAGTAVLGLQAALLAALFVLGVIIGDWLENR